MIGILLISIVILLFILLIILNERRYNKQIDKQLEDIHSKISHEIADISRRLKKLKEELKEMDK